MVRSPLHALIWSPDDGLYDLSIEGRAERRFRPTDEEAWQVWLRAVTSFAFHGASGSLNVYQEARSRGGRYWYAYHTARGRTRKRYLGRTERVSLARLEEVAAALADRPQPTLPVFVQTGQEADAAMTLPATKLAPPRLPIALVGRERLLDALDDAFSTPLTLVSAAAGWGKTTLLAAWVRRHPRRVVWLSLDALDDDPARFWTAAIAALRTRVPGVGALALAMLRSPQPPPITVTVTALLNELVGVGEQDAPMLLLLDDYQVIGGRAIHESLRFFLEHLPTHLHLLVSSRVDPDLPLARLRARGQLTEIRTADLRFTHEDAGTFLRQVLGFSLAEEEELTLERRTEGWAAGLQLAALSLRKQEDRTAWLTSFAGSHRYLLDYVHDEILAPLPLPIRRFLLQVTVLTRMSAALCEAVTGERASQEILETLERTNLFVVPLDEQREWYRLHDLFREALLARAEAVEPGLLPEAHRRAARWYADHGDGREAIGHALAAEDYPLVAELIQRAAPHLWLSGEAQTVHTWLHALPDDILLRHARLALDAVLRLLESLHATFGSVFASAQVRIERTLARVEAGLHGPEEPALTEAEVALLRRRLRLLRVLIETRAILPRADAGRLHALAEEIAGLAEGEEVRWQMIGFSLIFWLTFSIRHEGALLIPLLSEVKREAIQAGEYLAAIRVMLWLAYVYGQAGMLRRVERECREALAQAGRLDMHTAMTGYLQLSLAFTYYAWNRLEEATDACNASLRVAQTWQQTDQLIFGNLLLARLELVGGNPAAADQALQQAEAVSRRERSAYHAPSVAVARVRYWLETGNLARATEWSACTAFDLHTWVPRHAESFLTQVRVFLAERRYHEALEALERFGAQLDQPRDSPTTVEFLALHVVALHDAGKDAQARTVAARLRALTEPEGMLRVYLDAGIPMEQALTALLAAPPRATPAAPALPRAYIAQLLAAFAQERQGAGSPVRVAATASQILPRGEGIVPVSSALIEPLTRREREVLARLADGASNREIADALSLSVNTVKRHVGHLLGKLGATSRTGAVARARAVGLL